MGREEGISVKNPSMERAAKLLRVLVYAVLSCNILCLLGLPYIVLMTAWERGWALDYALILLFFFAVCGCCTAAVLWQAKCILDTIMTGNPFQQQNARAMNRAAAACWIISGCALARFVWETILVRSFVTIWMYNTLFIPGFFMAGLLFRVMAALFGQAAELKEDQDLTI